MKTFKYILTLVLALLVFAVQAQVITVHLMGDSTMAEKDLSLGSPERGWGMMFQNFLDKDVKVINYAHNGRSTKSFQDLGDWDKVKANVKEGDYVFIQFGHNDAKEDDPARYAPAYGAYQDNLRLFINTVRALGGKPVLLTPVSRRWFTEDGVFKENSHTDYPAAMKAVAEELNVPLLDITTPTENWIRSAGDMATRAYFMHLPKGKYASHPEGKEDNTHTNARGARKVTTIICEEIKKTLPEIAKHLVHYHIVVSADGHGDYMTVQEAINAVPDYMHKEITTIYIRKGTYHEMVTIPHNKFRVHLIGECADSTIITFDKCAKKTWPDREGDIPMGTSGSAAMYIQSSFVTLENLTVENPMRDIDGMGQAVALFLGGDHMVLKGCRLLGWQDTLYTYGYYNKFGGPCRLYAKDCYIEGTTDFIFGPMICLFEDCTIHCKQNSFITAASTLQQWKYGYVFNNCKITAAEGVTEVYLGRPWRPYAQTVFMNCELGSFIHPAGWKSWPRKDKNFGDGSDTAYYAEYKNHGPGAATSKRVFWSHQLTDKEAAEFTFDKIFYHELDENHGWNPNDNK